MYPGRNQIVHVQDVVRAGNSKEDQFLKRGLRIQHYIHGGRYGERHEAFGNSHGGHQNDTNGQQPSIGREITEQSAEFFALRHGVNASFYFRIQNGKSSAQEQKTQNSKTRSYPDPDERL
jgi:hypothetical protein